LDTGSGGSISALEGEMYHRAAVLILGLMLAPLLPAQVSTARLLGTITDPSGAVIPAANVLARDVAT